MDSIIVLMMTSGCQSDYDCSWQRAGWLNHRFDDSEWMSLGLIASRGAELLNHRSDDDDNFFSLYLVEESIDSIVGLTMNVKCKRDGHIFVAGRPRCP